MAGESGWQRVDATASICRWLSAATQSTMPFGAAWPAISNGIGSRSRSTRRVRGEGIRAAGYRPRSGASIAMARHGRAIHGKTLARPPLHSAREHAHVQKTGVTQNVHRTGGPLLAASDGDQQTRARAGEVVEATRQLLDGNVDGALQATERALEHGATAHVEHRRRVGS